jgi:hypothetical protein
MLEWTFLLGRTPFPLGRTVVTNSCILDRTSIFSDNPTCVTHLVKHLSRILACNQWGYINTPRFY